MLRSAALELATSFRLAVEIVVQSGDFPMHIQGFPRGCCGIISELMGETALGAAWSTTAALEEPRPQHSLA